MRKSVFIVAALLIGALLAGFVYIEGEKSPQLNQKRDVLVVIASQSEWPKMKEAIGYIVNDLSVGDRITLEGCKEKMEVTFNGGMETLFAQKKRFKAMLEKNETFFKELKEVSKESIAAYMRASDASFKSVVLIGKKAWEPVVTLAFGVKTLDLSAPLSQKSIEMLLPY